MSQKQCEYEGCKEWTFAEREIEHYTWSGWAPCFHQEDGSGYLLPGIGCEALIWELNWQGADVRPYADMWWGTSLTGQLRYEKELHYKLYCQSDNLLLGLNCLWRHFRELSIEYKGSYQAEHYLLEPYQ